MIKLLKPLSYLVAFLIFVLDGRFGLVSEAWALTFPLPPGGGSVVGEIQWTQALPGDNFSFLARRYDVGYCELMEANPGVNPRKPLPGTIIVVPTRFVLPPVPREGLVINLAELRLYYYPPKQKVVVTYPVGIGREGWSTPVGFFSVAQKMLDPVWYAPKSIRSYLLESQGIEVPWRVLPGPDNPLGGYALRLKQEDQFVHHVIHATNNYRGIGLRSTSKCISLFPEDMEELFEQVKVPTPVEIIHKAYKAGWDKGKLYLEAHIPLPEEWRDDRAELAEVKKILNTASLGRSVNLDWDLVECLVEERTGIPRVISTSSYTQRIAKVGQAERASSDVRGA